MCVSGVCIKACIGVCVSGACIQAYMCGCVCVSGVYTAVCMSVMCAVMALDQSATNTTQDISDTHKSSNHVTPSRRKYSAIYRQYFAMSNRPQSEIIADIMHNYRWMSRLCTDIGEIRR